MGVDDGGADEFEAAALEVFAQGVGLAAGGRQIGEGAKLVDHGLAIDKAPDVSVEAAEFVLHGEEVPCVFYGRADLAAIANQPGVSEHLFDVDRAEAGDLSRVEFGEGLAVVGALAEDGVPTEAGLGGLEGEKLKVLAVIVDGDAPLAVVVRDVIGLVEIEPRAALESHISERENRTRLGAPARASTARRICGPFCS